MNGASASTRRPLAHRGLLLAALLCLLLGACSAARFAYEQLDWFAEWQVGRYVSLTPAQDAQFEAGFAATWQWHRREVLPRWVSEMRSLATTLDEPRSAAQLDQMLSRYGREVRLSFEPLMPLVCSVGSQLDGEQVAEILEAVDEDIEDFRDEQIDPDPDVVRKIALKDLEKALRRNLGGLDPAQRKQVREWHADRPSISRDWLDYRLRWRDELAAVLKRREDAAFCSEITRLLFDGDVLWTEAQRKAFAADRLLWLQMLSGLQPTLSAEQKQRLRQRLSETADALAPLVPAAPLPSVSPVTPPPG